MSDEPKTPRNGAEPYMTVREMVSEIRTELKEMREEVAAKTVTDDHEDRLRRTERWLYALPPTVLIAVGGVVAALVR